MCICFSLGYLCPSQVHSPKQRITTYALGNHGHGDEPVGISTRPGGERIAALIPGPKGFATCDFGQGDQTTECTNALLKTYKLSLLPKAKGKAKAKAGAAMKKPAKAAAAMKKPAKATTADEESVVGPEDLWSNYDAMKKDAEPMPIEDVKEPMPKADEKQASSFTRKFRMAAAQGDIDVQSQQCRTCRSSLWTSSNHRHRMRWRPVPMA
jgi:hypothetical protein